MLLVSESCYFEKDATSCEIWPFGSMYDSRMINLPD